MRRNWSLWTVGLIILFAAVYFFQDPQWNGNSRLNLTRAIVEQGSFQIDRYIAQHDWATEDVALYQGHYYSDKAIGSSILAVPFYFLIYNFASALHLELGSALIKQLLTALVMGPALALNGMVMYKLAGRLGAPPARALTATLAVALGTMLWPYSAVFYGHVLAATFLILAFYLLFSMRQRAEGMSPVRFAGVGAAVGLAFITEYTTALVIAGLIIYALYVLRRQSVKVILRMGVAAALGALIPLAFMFAYNFSVYGNPVALGYTYEASDTFQEGMSLGLMGIHLPRRSVLFHITVDPRFGLFWASPVLLLSPIGYVLPFIRREHRAETLLSAYAVAAMLIMNAGYYLWWGGYAFGPRLIIPALSFFVVPLAMLPTFLDIPVMLLAALSIGQMLIPLLGQVQMAVDFRARFNTFFLAGKRFEGFSILYQHGLPLIQYQLEQGKASWTLGTALKLPYWLTVPALVAVEAALIRLYKRQVAEESLIATQDESRAES